MDAYDDPNIESDLGVYSAQFGLPSCTTANGCFKKVNQTGGSTYPRKDAGWSLEIALDVEIVHAICPNCKILLVEAKSNSFVDLIAAEDYAIAHATIVSNSWGGSEFSSETTSSYDGHFNHIGHPITFSSGDSGYGAEYPAASQYVTAVGGTTLTLNRTTPTRARRCGAVQAAAAAPMSQSRHGRRTQGVYAARWQTLPPMPIRIPARPIYDSVRYQGRSGWFQVGGTSLLPRLSLQCTGWRAMPRARLMDRIPMVILRPYMTSPPATTAAAAVRTCAQESWATTVRPATELPTAPPRSEKPHRRLAPTQ